MRIVFLINDLGVGGAEKMLLRYCRSLKARKHVVLVITLGQPGALTEDFKKAGLEVTSVSSIGKRSFVLRFCNLVTLINNFRPDVVSSWLYRSDFVLFFASFFIQCRNVGWNIRTSKLEFKEVAFSSWLLQQVNSYLSHWRIKFITYNSNSGKLFHEQLGYNKSIGIFLPNGYDIGTKNLSNDERLYFKNKLNISTQKKVITYVGRNSLIKDINSLYKVLKIIDKKLDKIVFLICGNGLDVRSMREYLGNYTFRNDIYYLGVVQDTNSIYQISDILLLTSFQEGFPNVIAEAMLSETICCAFNVGDCKAIIGDSMLVCEGRDVTELGEKIIKIVSLTESEIQEKKLRMRERIKNMYSLDEAVCLYENVLKAKVRH